MLSGGVSAIGMYFPSVWFLGIFALIPFARVLSSLGADEWRKAFVFGTIFGLASSGSAVAMFWTVLPLDWIGVETLWRGFSMVLFSWTTVVMTLAVFFGLFGVVFARLKTNSWTDSLLAASLWTLTHYVQMFGFALLTIAPASLIGPHFSSSFIGYTLAWSDPLLQLARFGGVYALTFVVVLLAFFIAQLIFASTGTLRVRAIGTFFVASIVILSGLVTVPSKTPEHLESRSFALVSDSTLGRSTTADDRKKHAVEILGTNVALAASQPVPDIFVFPEAIDLLGRTETDVHTFREKAFGGEPVSIIDSRTIGAVGEMRKLRMFMYDGVTESVAVYDKMFFVPQGEYTPILGRLALRLLGGADFVETVEKYRSFERGTSLVVPSLADAKMGALFCFEVLSPQLYRKLARDGAEVLVNATSQGFFHASPFMDTYILGISKVRAVETGRYLVVAGYFVPASVISNTGQIVTRSARSETAVLEADIPLLKESTPYVRFGDWVLLMPTLIVLLHFIRTRRK
jgi:apolipoprotein N-acyltransferase